MQAAVNNCRTHCYETVLIVKYFAPLSHILHHTQAYTSVLKIYSLLDLMKILLLVTIDVYN